METGIIKYNLKERGRQFRGRERHFDCAAIAAAINSAVCQERVQNRDMLGYFGHWPRVKFGMMPQEGGVDYSKGGKPFVVEPAIVTTFLRANSDGTIEHKAEFLGTDSGQVAAKMFSSRVGGFSSAIDAMKPEFFGFDYVQEPNYATNRGYALDDVRGMTLDDIDAAIYDEQIRGMLRLLDSAHTERDYANVTIEQLRAENEELLTLLAKREEPAAVLDSAFIMPPSVSLEPMTRIMRGVEAFNALSNLPGTTEKGKAEPTMPEVYDHILNGRLR